MQFNRVRLDNVYTRVLKAHIGDLTASVAQVQYSGNSPLSWDSRLRLLRYFLQRGKYDLLDGLELLPLANGGFTEVRFNPRRAERAVYTAPSADVFRLLLVAGSCLEDEFLDMDIDKDVRKMLLDAAKKGIACLLYSPFSSPALAACRPILHSAADIFLFLLSLIHI